jgi:hypothetical protein
MKGRLKKARKTGFISGYPLAFNPGNCSNAHEIGFGQDGRNAKSEPYPELESGYGSLT